MAAVRGAPPRPRGHAPPLPALLGLALLLLAGGLFKARLGWACPPQAAPPQRRREARSRAGPAASGDGEPGFSADGYELPPECAKHAVLYGQIFNDLAPWFDTGITDDDVDACGVPRGGTGGPNATQGGENFRYVFFDGVLHTSSERIVRDDLFGQHYFQLTTLQDAAARWGLPEGVEVVVSFNDNGAIRVRTDSGALCPLLTMGKERRDYDILMPEGQFVEHGFDEFVAAPDPVPWAEKDARAVARYSDFCPNTNGASDRHGVPTPCPREHYAKLCNSSEAEAYADVGFVHERGFLSLLDQRRFKYALDTDGWGPALRFYKLLASGQAVLKDHSNEYLFFTKALTEWVHYIPIRWNSQEELFATIRWLRKNDAVARSVAAAGHAFARRHLVEEGRLCYVKVLFEEMAKLRRSTRTRRADYARLVPIEEELAAFPKPERGVGMRQQRR